MGKTNRNYSQLKSGSDVRGVATGEGTVLTDTVVSHISAAFAEYLSKLHHIPVENVSIAVGRDSRITGPSLLHAACIGIAKAGAKAFDCGMCTTPSMFMAIHEPGFEPTGSIMMTASHHPWNINGMKFFTETGGVGYSDLTEILTTAESIELTSINDQSIESYPYIPLYQRNLEKMIHQSINNGADKPLEGLHIIVDAGNGAGGFYADMLAGLGATTSGSQFLEADGHFPNHPPNPENTDAMNSLSAAVLKHGADLGVIFDADCDRAAIVGSSGEEINRNRLIALISSFLLQENPGATIVTDSVTSSGLAQFIQDLGGIHYRYKRGYRNVIDEAIRLNQEGIDCPLAIETSGHAAMRENRFLDDGMYLVTYLIIRAMLLREDGETLFSKIKLLKEPVESNEYRIKILVPEFKKAGEAIIRFVMNELGTLKDCRIASDNREGVRISFDLSGGKDNGWILLRLSVHDPVMPLNAESDVPGGNQQMIQRLYSVLQTQQDIDLTVLSNAI